MTTEVDELLYGYKLDESQIAKTHLMFLGYTGKVHEALLGCTDTYLSFFSLLMKIGAGSPGELRDALFELREAGVLVKTKNVMTLEYRILPRSPRPKKPTRESRMAAVRAKLRQAVSRGDTDQVDLAALHILIEDHRRLSNEISISPVLE